MKALIFLILFLELLKSTLANDEFVNHSSEKRLIRKLMSVYEHYGINGRPVRESTLRVNVSYGLALIQILGLDEDSQVLRTNCWGRYKWKDDLMKWDPEEYGNITQIRVFKHQIWVPDIQLFNFADTRLQVHRDARLVVYNNGQILWVPQALFKSSCSVEISYFPFDVQICIMDFGSWTYDISQLELYWWTLDEEKYSHIPMAYIDFTDYINSNEWDTDGQKEKKVYHWLRTEQIKSIRMIRQMNVTDGNKNITKTYRVLRYRVRLYRKPSFYIFILIIPCVLLSSLVIIVFWLPPESPAKLMLGMNIFVAFFVLLLLLKSSIPTAVKNFPLIGSFFCLNMIMITLSTFLVAVVINFYIRGDKKGPIPNCIRRVMIDGIGRYLFVSQFINLPKSGESSRLQMEKDRIDAQGSISSKHRFSRQKSQNDASQQRDSSFNEPEIRNTQFTSASNKKSFEWDPPESPLISNYVSNLHKQTKSSIENNVREIRRFVRLHVAKQKEIQRRNQMTMEWRTLALVLDRLFCILYIATIFIAVIVAVPTQKNLLARQEAEDNQ